MFFFLLILDQQYIIKRSTYLINQMVSVEGQLVALKDTPEGKFENLKLLLKYIF